jgi:probable rRNA maturation factor
MNKSWFGKDRPTNVISFSYMESSPGISPDEDGRRLAERSIRSGEIIGDIIISLERAQEEAGEAGCPFYERLFALVIHGLLHITGFDHVIEKSEARKMKYRERKLLGYVRSHRLYRDLVPGDGQ